jgi:hypothetical protein
MKKFCLLSFVFVVSTMPLAAFGQVTIANSPVLYKPSENYNDCDNNNVCFVDSEIVNAQHRNVPIRIRYPRNAPAGRLPFILWSHGGGLNDNGRQLNETWGRTLTRAGYIVVHMSHRTMTQAQATAVCAEFGVTVTSECVLFSFMTVMQPRDANVVLGALDAIEQTVPELNNRIDRSNIAVAGWSGGSLTAMAMAGARFRLSNTATDVSFANPLPKAFLALSPQGPNYLGFKTDSWREITRPVLTATGPGDTTEGEDAPSRLVAFRSMPAGKKYQLYIKHPATNHGTFNLENDAFPQFSQWLATYALAFFDSHLKNKPLAGAYLISSRLPLQGSRKTVLIGRK